MRTPIRRTVNVQIALIVLLLTLYALPASGHFILPMQVDRPGYFVNIEFIQWHEGFVNTGEPPTNDLDIAGIKTGRVVLNVYLFDRSYQPINNAEVRLTLRSGETELGPWDLEYFLEASYTTTQEIPDSGAWDAIVSFEIPEEATPVTARFVEFAIEEADGSSAAGRVIEAPDSGGVSPLVWLIGGISVIGIAGLIIFGMKQGRKNGTNQEE